MFHERAAQWRHKWYITTELTARAGTPYALCRWTSPCYECVRLCAPVVLHSLLNTILSWASAGSHGAWQPHSDLLLAQMSIHLSTCQSRCHGDGLAKLGEWQGSGTALPGGSCVLIWVVKDARGQGEMGYETLWENVGGVIWMKGSLTGSNGHLEVYWAVCVCRWAYEGLCICICLHYYVFPCVHISFKRTLCERTHLCGDTSFVYLPWLSLLDPFLLICIHSQNNCSFI